MISRERDSGRLLRAHFFKGLMHNDLVSPSGDTELALIQVLCVVAAPGLLFAYGILVQHIHSGGATGPDERAAGVMVARCLLTGFSMLVVAFVAILQWDSLLLDRRDLRILGALPIRARTVRMAKAWAVVGFLALFALSVNAFPAFVLPLVSVPAGSGPLVVVRHAAAHLVAVGGATAFVAFTAVAASRVARGRGVQTAALVLLVQGVFLIPPFLSAMREDGGELGLVALLPPTWFVELYGALAGGPGVPRRDLAAVATLALVVSACIVALAYASGTSDPAAVARAGSAGPHPGVGRLERAMIGLSPGGPPGRAVFWFTLKTVSRSAPHRLHLAAYAGVGFALSGVPALLSSPAADGTPANLANAWMHASLVLMLSILVGLRNVFAVPAVLGANWPFRLTAERDTLACAAGVRRAAALIAAVPGVLLMWPLASFVSIWPALGHVGFCVAWIAASVELLFLRFPKVPFTCSYHPAKANLRLYWAVYFIGFLAYLDASSTLERWMLGHPLRYAVGLTCFSTIAAACKRLRRDGAASLQFEDGPAGSAIGLDLDA